MKSIITFFILTLASHSYAATYKLRIEMTNVTHNYYFETGVADAQITFDENRCAIKVKKSIYPRTNFRCFIEKRGIQQYVVRIKNEELQSIVRSAGLHQPGGRPLPPSINNVVLGNMVWGYSDFDVAWFEDKYDLNPFVSLIPTIARSPNSKYVEKHFTNSTEFLFTLEKI
jgi:hypothetical protein